MALFTAVVVGALHVSRDASHGGVRVLVPRPVPWPVVAIPGYGVTVGAVAYLIEALAG
ncbi:hypothetical protein [Streptomyces sp. NPDC126933]|uniref:hypothetical protein n=1 Tax=unclassified Streptomyces TaxID=2593676 RepID=UPI00364ABBB2